MNLNHNETQFFSTWSFENATDIKSALNYINQKLNEITRQVSFWDIYNVTQVLLNDNDLTSKLAILNIGEAAIVNANVLTDGKENHYRGDIAYRKADGNLIWIPAENKGIYKPSIRYHTNEQGEGMLQVTYTYQATTPEEGWTDTVYMNADTKAGYLFNVDTATFSEVTPQTTPRTFSYSFDAIYVTKDGETFLLKPIIKFYMNDGHEGFEEFYPDCVWVESSSKIIVTIGFHFDTNKVYMRVR